MIMLTRRGRSGANQRSLGGVAEAVLKRTAIPVFLIPSEFVSAPVISVFSSILVPLDGSELAEQSLPYVRYLASIRGSETVLHYVEPSHNSAVSGDQPMALRHGAGRIGNAMTYLSIIACRLASSGIKARTKLTVGHPGREIAREAIDGAADLLVVCSHGRTGLAERPFGAVTDHVLRTSAVPVLLVRASIEGHNLEPTGNLTPIENWAGPSSPNPVYRLPVTHCVET